jgi:hypothetical protein
VESRVRARLEVSGSNPDLRNCAYFIKKNYSSVVEGVAGWWGFFFLFVLLFLIFSNFFHILEIDL